MCVCVCVCKEDGGEGGMHMCIVPVGEQAVYTQRQYPNQTGLAGLLGMDGKIKPSFQVSEH